MRVEERRAGRLVEQVGAEHRDGGVRFQFAELRGAQVRFAVADIQRVVAELAEGLLDVAVLDALVIRAARERVAGVHANLVAVRWPEERGDAREPAELAGKASARHEPAMHVVAAHHMVAFGKLALEMIRHLRRGGELVAEIDVDVAHGVLQPADRALGDLGCGDELADDGLQRMLVRPQALQAAVEQHAITDGDHEQYRHQGLDHQT